MTFSTFVTPARESDTWMAGADACTSGNRETGVRSIDSGGYRADARSRARCAHPARVRGAHPGGRKTGCAAVKDIDAHRHGSPRAAARAMQALMAVKRDRR